MDSPVKPENDGRWDAFPVVAVVNVFSTVRFSRMTNDG
jgi:hypothetical protein